MSFAPEMKPVSQMKHGEMAQYGDDRGLMVRFFKEPVYQEFASIGGIQGGSMPAPGTFIPGPEVEGAGHPVYKDVDMVHIMIPGNKSELTRRVRLTSTPDMPSDPERWPRQWAQFKAQEEQTADGLPVQEWPPLGKSQVIALKAAGIHTVEQLSGLPDSSFGSVHMLDVRKYRDLAINYLKNAVSNAPVQSLMAQVETLKAEMERMREANEALAANQRKAPGRPPNALKLTNPLGEEN